MKQGITIQERLKDLRTERHLKLEELTELTQISKSALGSYENDVIVNELYLCVLHPNLIEYTAATKSQNADTKCVYYKKEISHKSILKLAEFYGVSTDYLLCATENRNRPDAGLTELHINDDMVELLKSGRINNRLLCEIATHENFTALMTDAEIYVDGIATMRFQDINASLEAVRAEILKKYQPEEEDTTLKALQASQIQEEDYFCHVTHKEWDAILNDIRLAHEADAESAPDDSSTLKIIEDAEKAMRFPGNALDKFCYVMCSQLQISYEKLTEKERTDLKNIMKKSGIYKDSSLVSRKC